MDSPLASVYAHADISHETFLNMSSALQLLKSVGFMDVEVHPSMILNRHPIKELIRKAIWKLNLWRMKLVLFATGRTWDEVQFTPNIIITAKKA